MRLHTERSPCCRRFTPLEEEEEEEEKEGRGESSSPIEDEEEAIFSFSILSFFSAFEEGTSANSASIRGDDVCCFCVCEDEDCAKKPVSLK